MPEFDLIDRLARHVAPAGRGVEIGIGDDAAVLALARGEVLVAATDTLNEGVHFTADADPVGIGHKLLAVNLSDLAAMGAEPRWALMNLTLPAEDSAWVDAFAEGFFRLAKVFGVQLVGGDTCAGPRSLSLTLLGVQSPGTALTRSGARAGDRIFISGSLGDAALAWRQRQAGTATLPDSLARALDQPEPRVALGAALRGLATACIDLSDGLFADLGHLAHASGLGAQLAISQLPASSRLREVETPERWDLQLCGGDDYELCFTVPPAKTPSVLELGRALSITLTDVGVMTDSGAVACLGPDGEAYEPARQPWNHFAMAGGEQPS